MNKQTSMIVRPVKLVPGTVDRRREHIQLSYGDSGEDDEQVLLRVALVAPREDGDFTVEVTFPADPRDEQVMNMLISVGSQLDYYLVEKGEPDPWAYAVYHCRSGANLLSDVHWAHYPTGSWREEIPEPSDEELDEVLDYLDEVDLDPVRAGRHQDEPIDGDD